MASHKYLHVTGSSNPPSHLTSPPLSHPLVHTKTVDSYLCQNPCTLELGQVFFLGEKRLTIHHLSHMERRGWVGDVKDRGVGARRERGRGRERERERERGREGGRERGGGGGGGRKGLRIIASCSHT